MGVGVARLQTAATAAVAAIAGTRLKQETCEAA